MKGIYAIVDKEGRVYYVGQSKDVDARAWAHEGRINTSEEKYKKEKKYLILGRLREFGVQLQFRVIEEFKDNEVIDLLCREREYIKKLKPVLNAAVPNDCIAYIKNFDQAGYALIQAEKNGRWDFSKFRRVW